MRPSESWRPGDLLHLDIKKPGRVERPGHCMTGALIPSLRITTDNGAGYRPRVVAKVWRRLGLRDTGERVSAPHHGEARASDPDGTGMSEHMSAPMRMPISGRTGCLSTMGIARLPRSTITH